MKALFKPSGKSKKIPPNELVRKLMKSLAALEELKYDSKNEDKKDSEKKSISTYLDRALEILIPEGDSQARQNNEDFIKLSQEIYHHNLFTALIKNLDELEFESRKVASRIFKNLLIRQIGTRYPMVNHIAENPEILFLLLDGYKHQSNSGLIVALCGDMLRECLTVNDQLVKILLYDEKRRFYSIFEYVNHDAFDIASDAFRTFRDALIHKNEKDPQQNPHNQIVAQFLNENYSDFFEHYSRLLRTDNYVTIRQSLKLLSELLLNRENFSVLQRYVADEANLKEMMKLLAHPDSNAIKFEAFHVFKCFVASPTKSPGVAKVLYTNQEKLIEFLEKFQPDRQEDEGFQEEKRYLIKQIRTLEKPVDL